MLKILPIIPSGISQKSSHYSSFIPVSSLLFPLIMFILVSIAKRSDSSIRVFERSIRVYQFLEAFQLLSAGEI